MKIAVASGKGGTGKTTIAVALALASDEPVQLLDCDVEEPNCHIFLSFNTEEEADVEVLKPVIDETKCINCGRCAEICQFNAIVNLKIKTLVFPELCHSCGGCSLVCPTKAITEEKYRVGILQKANSIDLEFAMGKLDIGQAMAVPVIKAVKALADNNKIVIFDAPPGTSCPFIQTVSDTDFVILITEPTPFGRHDLSLAVDTIRKLGIPFAVIINRVTAKENLITEYCRQQNIDIFLQISEDRAVAEAYSRGENLLQAKPQLKTVLQDVIIRIKNILDPGKTQGGC